MTGTRKHYNDGFEGPPLEAGITWFDPASAGSPKGGDAQQAPSRSDNIAVGAADAPNTLSTCNSTTIGERQAIAEAGFCANINRKPAEQDIQEAINHVRALCQFAYDQGYHELGYDPVEVLSCVLATPATNAPVAETWDGLDIPGEARSLLVAEFPGDDPMDDAGRVVAGAIRAIEKLLAASLPIHGEMREALEALVTAVTYADPPKLFNDVLCHAARVPVEFVIDARNALQGDGL